MHSTQQRLHFLGFVLCLGSMGCSACDRAQPPQAGYPPPPSDTSAGSLRLAPAPTEPAGASRGQRCEPPSSTSPTLRAQLDVTTRVDVVSPETVYFSAQQSRDESCVDLAGGQDMEACRTGQYLDFSFDFDDPDSGTFSTTGNSKNTQRGGSPRAIHTFVCEGPRDARFNPKHSRCEHAVRVTVKNPKGEEATACVQVNVRPQASAYATTDTYCVSSDADFAGCPSDVPKANRLRQTPRPGHWSGRRVLFERGSRGVYEPICIGYDERNVRIGAYGDGPRPVVDALRVGVAAGCEDRVPNTEEAARYPKLTRNAAGDIVAGWAFDVGVSDLRLGSIQNGIAATLVTMHDLDLDWSRDDTYQGSVQLATNGHNCGRNPRLDCRVVPYPYGVFVSEVRALGNPSALPLINIYCLTNCGLVNGGVIGSEAKAAIEHNSRFMGVWGLVVSNSWFRGDHLGSDGRSRGPKHKLTLRQLEKGTTSSKRVNPEDFVRGNHDGNGPGWVRESDPSRQYTPHYVFVIDSIFGDEVQAATSDEASYLHISAGHQYTGVFGAKFIAHANAPENAAQLSVGGRNIVVAGTRYNERSFTCRPSREHDGSDPYYFDESTIFSDAPDGRCDARRSKHRRR